MMTRDEFRNLLNHVSDERVRTLNDVFNKVNEVASVRAALVAVEDALISDEVAQLTSNKVASVLGCARKVVRGATLRGSSYLVDGATLHDLGDALDALDGVES